MLNVYNFWASEVFKSCIYSSLSHMTSNLTNLRIFIQENTGQNNIMINF